MLDKPSPPRGPLEVSGMSATSFTLQWKSSENDGGSPILEYIVEIKEAKSKKEFKKMGATKGDITDIAVNYLEKDHGYMFRITARNAIGISEPYLPEDVIVAGSRISTYLSCNKFNLTIAALRFLIQFAICLGVNYRFEKTDTTLYCLLGIFPPTKLYHPSKLFPKNRS